MACPNCAYKTKKVPITGICTKCGEYSHIWNIVDKQRYLRRCKVKMYFYLILALLFIVCAFMAWGYDVSSLVENTHGGSGSGKAIIIIIPLYVLAFIGEIFFGKYVGVSIGLILLSVILLILSYLNFNKIKNSINYESHDA